MLYSALIAECHSRSDNAPSARFPPLGREMVARTGTSFVGFSTVTSPGGSLYVANLKVGDAGRLHEPLMRVLHGEREPLLKLDGFSRDGHCHRDQRADPVVVHGTNALNNVWGWMV